MNKFFKNAIVSTLILSFIVAGGFSDLVLAKPSVEDLNLQNNDSFKRARASTKDIESQSQGGIRKTTKEVVSAPNTRASRSAKQPASTSRVQQNAQLNDAAYTRGASNPRRETIRTAPGSFDVNTARPTNSQRSTASKSASAYSAGLKTKRTPTSGTKDVGNTNETFGGYAVKSVSTKEKVRKERAAARATAAARRGNSTRTISFNDMKEGNRNRTRRSNSFTNYYGDSSLKVYDQRGRQISPTTSQKDRTVIIIPRSGKAVTGLVTADDPGRTITIKDPSGASVSYAYSEMDALVNI